jgi:hypothetical protein
LGVFQESLLTGNERRTAGYAAPRLLRVSLAFRAVPASTAATALESDPADSLLAQPLSAEY